MKIKDTLYVRVLVWAYQKGGQSFTREEMRSSLSFSPKEMSWVEKAFYEGPNGSYPLIGHFESRDSQDYFLLSDRGITAAINYLALEEAQKSGKRAECIALCAIGISAVVGIIQIAIALC